MQEPAEYQMRMRPMWLKDGGGWTEWAKCSHESYLDYVKTPELHSWQYETRILYEHQPTQNGVHAVPVNAQEEKHQLHPNEIRRRAYERAAQVCDKKGELWGSDAFFSLGREIRALSNEPVKKG